MFQVAEGPVNLNKFHPADLQTFIQQNKINTTQYWVQKQRREKEIEKEKGKWKAGKRKTKLKW